MLFMLSCLFSIASTNPKFTFKIRIKLDHHHSDYLDIELNISLTRVIKREIKSLLEVKVDDLNATNTKMTDIIGQAESAIHKPVKKKGRINRMRKVPCLGIFFAILYAFFMSTAVTAVKLIKIHPVEVLALRSAVQAIFFGAVSLYNKRSFLGAPQEKWSLLGRAISGAVNQGCWYTSVRLISLTDSSAVYYSAPVFVALLAYIFLKEPFGFFEVISIVVTIAGVITISKPSFIPIFGNQTESLKGEHMEGLLYALGGALTFACSNIFLRKLQKTSTEITSFWFSMACIILGVITVAWSETFTLPRGFFEWFIILASGISGVLGNICFVTALKIEKAGPVSVAQTCNIVIVLIYQIAFFKEPPSANTFIGAFLIASSVAMTGLKDVFKETQFLTNLKNFASNTVSYQVDSKLTGKPATQSVAGKYMPYNKEEM
ncbi:solute carrier family 35 member G1-like isoform X1 [Tetranychus urticae]|uniref:solute carrier family 35 member G1-like isoform X1 n=2 Tax=Tetranychus urticae TaxID=32264 RepID=UPI000D65391D|nr:solute carrier family 35 member G1-like isoform X1 [Tetranychus urticae]XP_025018124.1 solute carrier family 35 member G1-like isoform X1 [Tetranychus urticae]